jgi:hypothetical protein
MGVLIVAATKDVSWISLVTGQRRADATALCGPVSGECAGAAGDHAERDLSAGGGAGNLAIGQSVPVALTVAELQPGQYTVNTSGSGAGIVTNALTGQLITASNPAHAGDFLVIYGTRLGALVGANGEAEPADGAVAPSTILISDDRASNRHDWRQEFACAVLGTYADVCGALPGQRAGANRSNDRQRGADRDYRYGCRDRRCGGIEFRDDYGPVK